MHKITVHILRTAVDECIQQLAQEWYDLPAELVIITVMHFLTTMPGAAFADKRCTIHTIVLEAMMAPEREVRGMYMQARAEGNPPRSYQLLNAMVAARFSIWQGHHVKTYGPLSNDPVTHWIGLKEAVLGIICSQVVKKVTSKTALEQLKNGKWSQKENQTVSEL